MRKFKILPLLLLLLTLATSAAAQKKTQKTYIPWSNGKLVVSEEGRYLKHENGTPFFWLGETGWLLPERLNRDEAEYYLEQCKRRGYNVIQVQTLNNVPSMNIYGQYSMTDGYNFKNINQKGVYGYWDHMDYIIRTAAKKGLYIGMVCIWGSPVSHGEMNVDQAKAYGKFLAERYKDEPNIIWFIGGDIRGDVKTAEWEALATSIKAIDKNHLMTFHPRGRTTSATWFNNAPWLDFNMFQSGHRRYGQRFGDGDYPIEENTEEDNWRFVERSMAMKPMKPVIDGEPIYEEIPHGLHDENELLWKDYDVRRYAYWSVFAGSFGHTYGHNSIMQFIKPGVGGAYGAKKPWYDALIQEYFDAIARKGYIVEINTKSYLELGTFYPNERYFPVLLEKGIRVQVNSDSHYPERINNGRLQALAALQASGYHTVTERYNNEWKDMPLIINT